MKRSDLNDKLDFIKALGHMEIFMKIDGDIKLYPLNYVYKVNDDILIFSNTPKFKNTNSKDYKYDIIMVFAEEFLLYKKTLGEESAIIKINARIRNTNYENISLQEIVIAANILERMFMYFKEEEK